MFNMMINFIQEKWPELSIKHVDETIIYLVHADIVIAAICMKYKSMQMYISCLSDNSITHDSYDMVDPHSIDKFEAQITKLIDVLKQKGLYV